MKWTATLLILAACGNAAPAPEAPRPEVAVIARDAGTAADAELPDAEAPDAEVDFWSEPIGLDEVDTTVTIEELRAIDGWGKAEQVKRGGDVMLALHITDDAVLRLSVVEDNTGIVRTYALGPATFGVNHHTIDGDAFPARTVIGEYVGPIVFAVRVDGRQVAVWTDGRELRAAERATTWTPLLRVQFPEHTTFLGIGTTYPH